VSADRRAAIRAQRLAGDGLELVEPTDRQMSRVPVRDPELYNELHRRATNLALAHAAVFGDTGTGAGQVRQVADGFARELAGVPANQRTRRAAQHVVTALIHATEYDDARTWGTTLGRVLVGLGAYPGPRMSRTTAGLVLGVSKQRISQMVAERLLGEDGAGVHTASVARLLALE
jgi:hypothetical protein